MESVRSLRSRLSGGTYDPLLEKLYGTAGIPGAKGRISSVLDCFVRQFSLSEETPVTLCSAPGRTEIGGNHTDHQLGRVLTGSVDLDALACAALNGSRLIRIYSEGHGVTEVDLSTLVPVPSEVNTTPALVRGMAAAAAERGYAVSGFDAYITSDVPGGSGLSSSACFEVLLGVVINHLFCGDALSLEEIAKIGQTTENVFFGKPSGLMDQMGCALGGIVSIDFKEKEHPQIHQVSVDFASAGYALCIIDSGADHADLTDDYAGIPHEMGSVAGYFGKSVLSEVSEEAFYESLPAIRALMGDRAVLRAAHYYADCKKASDEVAALEAGDFDEFLRLVTASGHSSFEDLQNVSTFRDPKDQPVAIALAAAAHALRGKGAYRVHGGGFAGTIQAFVPLEMVESFRSEVDALLGSGSCKVTAIRPIGGCVIA